MTTIDKSLEALGTAVLLAAVFVISAVAVFT